MRVALLGAAIGIAGVGVAEAATTVPGHTGGRTDADENGISDAGVIVSGNYSDTYVDGATTCKLRVVCKGPDGTTTFNYQIVHESDPRYRGNPDWAVWGTWEYHVLTQGGQGNEPYGGNGNLVRPYSG
jgi:hypothetical protein